MFGKERSKDQLPLCNFQLCDTKGGLQYSNYKNEKSTVQDSISAQITSGLELAPEQTDYLLPHFLCLIVGKPGSGKTFIARKMIVDEIFYGKKFDKVFVVSPSYEKMDLDLQRNNMETSFSLQWIFTKILKCNLKQLKRLQKVVGENEFQDMVKNPVSLPNKSMRGIMEKTVPTQGKLAAYQQKSFLRQGRLMAQIFTHHEKTQLQNEKYGGANAGRKVIKERSRDKKFIQKGKPFISNEKGVHKKSAKIEFDPSLLKPEHMGSYAGRANLLNFISELQRRFKTSMVLDQIKQMHLNVLLVLDDVVGSIKSLENDPHLAQLFFNRRHLVANGTISIIVVSQKYTMIPSRLRSNANWLILFKLNPIDFENVYKDAITLSKLRWFEMLTFIYGEDTLQEKELQDEDKRYANLGVWIEKDKYFKNFQSLMF